MPVYRHKPTEIEAFRFGYDSTPDFFKQAINDGRALPGMPQDEESETPHWLIVAECARNTMGCQIPFRVGDYIVKKHDGRLYVYDEVSFNRLYTLIAL